MWRRAVQILGTLLLLLGCSFVGCTLAMERWRVAPQGGEGGSQGGSQVLVSAWFWSSLWKDCSEDSSGLVNCVDLGLLWTVKEDIQAVRALLLSGLCLGLVGTALSFCGMECTHVGGGERSSDRTLMTASAVHLLGCAADVAAYCLYINKVSAAFLHSRADPAQLRYELGTPLYLGLGGSFLIFLGCSLHCATACRVFTTESRKLGVPFPGEETKFIYRASRNTSSTASAVVV